MEIMFNELSACSYSSNKYEAFERMTQFVKAFIKSRDFGFKRIRSSLSVSEIHLTDDYTVVSWLNDRSISRDLKSFMYGSIIIPFINDADVKIEDQFIEADFFYKRNEDEKESCLGLAAAYLYELPSISLNSAEEWQRNLLSILIEKDCTSEEHQIPNVFSESCFSNESISVFIENLGEVELIESPLKPDEKDIQLSDHHGKKELRAFCDKLKHNQYITSMRSTNWGGNTFIRKIHKNGVIEITLQNTDRKYALNIQTTGRNYRETEAIAQKIRERYS